MTHVIRTATADDAGSLAELAAVTFPLACPPGSDPKDIEAHLASTLSRDNFRAYLADPMVTVLVIDAGGELRGYSLLVARPAQDPDVASVLTELPCTELSKCYVHPDAPRTRRRGRTDACQHRLGRRFGARGLWLGVNSQNARAIRFYEKSGFRRVGTKSFKLGSTVEHDFVMERPVEP